MRLDATDIEGVFTVDVEPATDNRGFFARTFDAVAFAAVGLDPTIAECSVSYNHFAGTLRGMHFQQAPFGETKLVRCSQGRVFDVAVDARLDSATFGRVVTVELSAANRTALLLSPGIAHGFLTLEDASEVSYQISVSYRPEASAGFRWDDPLSAIAWPMVPVVLSDRDRALPSLVAAPYAESMT